MSALTPKLDLPYPTSGDLVQNVDDAIAALATATESAILRVGGGWRIVTANNAIATVGYSVLPVAADFNAARASITKTDAASGLLVSMTGSASLTAGGAQRCNAGVRINGVDFDLCPVYLPALNARTPFAAQRIITGLSAGAKTIDPVFHVAAGGSTLQLWANDDYVTLTVREVA